MDRRRRRTRALGLAAALAASAALAAGAAPPLRAMRWAAPSADPGRAFATQPAECLRTPADPQAALALEVGRAAFRTPVLLGGQAARAGLTCESCHRAGRDNPDFQFPGASGAPGTADVTLSLFSSHRGNGAHDPKPIPDLSGPRAALKVGAADRQAFIAGLITEEFDGPPPSAATLAGLAAYVGALSPEACPAPARVRVTPALLMADARRALGAARAEAAGGDTATAVLMVAAARARLGLIDERYAGLPAEQRRVRAADAELADLQDGLREGGPDTPARIAAWSARSGRLEAALKARASRSLFDPRRLADAANRRLPGGPS